MPNMALSVDLHGPFFDNPKPETVQALENTIQEIVLLGERELTQMAQPSPGGVFHSREYAATHGYFQTGHYNRSINGRMVDSMHGVLSDSGVVYGPWLEGTGSRNQTTRFKGYSLWRKTRDKIDGMTQGIFQKHVNILKGKLG